MATIIIITVPKKPPTQPNGQPIPDYANSKTSFHEVPENLSPSDALLYIADQMT